MRLSHRGRVRARQTTQRLTSTDTSIGWLAKIKLSDEAQFDALLNEEQYKTLCEGSS